MSRVRLLLETEGLAASLRRDRAEVLRWKDENPLRLVAAAILDVPDMKLGRASKKSIGERVVPDVMESSSEWENWWKKVQPALSGSPHFDYDPKNARKGVRRKSKPSEIEPASRSEPVAASPKTRDDKPRAAPSRSSALRLVDWIDWAQSDDEYVSIPRGIPPEGLAAYLRKQPAVLVPKTIDRLSDAIVEKLLNANPSSRPSPGSWLDLLLASLDRWVDLVDRGDVSISDTIGFYTRLSAALGAEACQSLVKPLASYTSANVNNASVMADAILASSNRAPSETQALLGSLHSALGEPARKALWQRLITSDSGQISSWLSNRWRNMPSDSEKGEIVSSLIVLARDSGSVGDIDSLLSDMWNMAESNLRAHLFNPILMGWILHREMMPKVEGVLQKLAEEIGNDDGQDPESIADSPHENPIMRRWRGIVKFASQNKIGRLRAEHQREIAEKDRLLNVAESEIERVGKGKIYFQEKLREAASSTSLRFNREAIVMLGEWLWDLFSSPLAPHPEIKNVEDKISSTLMALGAKPFGEIGEIVPFDPSLHEANPSPPPGSRVKIAAPGVSYFRDVDAPYTMVKIKVKVE